MRYKKYLTLIFLSISFIWACGSGQKPIQDFKTDSSSSESAASRIFDAKCSMCHSLHEDKIGPSLAGVAQRWGDINQLKSFIKSPQSVINSGDAYSVALYNKWNNSNMPAFPHLTEQELDALLEYLK